MDVLSPFASFLIALVIGVACGLVFMGVTADSRFKMIRDCTLGVIASLIGWGFTMCLPVNQYKNVGADFVALGASITLLHLYWTVFKERSNILKEVDAGSPDNPFIERERPTHGSL